MNSPCLFPRPPCRPPVESVTASLSRPGPRSRRHTDAHWSRRLQLQSACHSGAGSGVGHRRHSLFLSLGDTGYDSPNRLPHHLMGLSTLTPPYRRLPLRVKPGRRASSGCLPEACAGCWLPVNKAPEAARGFGSAGSHPTRACLAAAQGAKLPPLRHCQPRDRAKPALTSAAPMQCNCNAVCAMSPRPCAFLPIRPVESLESPRQAVAATMKLAHRRRHQRFRRQMCS